MKGKSLVLTLLMLLIEGYISAQSISLLPQSPSLEFMNKMPNAKLANSKIEIVDERGKLVALPSDILVNLDWSNDIGTVVDKNGQPLKFITLKKGTTSFDLSVLLNSMTKSSLGQLRLSVEDSTVNSLKIYVMNWSQATSIKTEGTQDEASK